jgi:hypothetical protein
VPSGGLIGIPAQETARFSDFARSLVETNLYEGWEVTFRFGHDIADNTNALIQTMLDRDKDWFWYMGDDHVWSPDLLTKLLAQTFQPGAGMVPGRAIIVPLCLMRNPPYRPVIWREETADFVCADPSACSPPHDDNRFARVELNDHPDGGVIEIAAAGGAGMLIHRSVFEAMEKPWFDAGRGTTARVGEDINFCEKARAAGYKIWCDLDASLGHCCTSVVWPVREADGWTFGFSMMGGFKVTMPPGFQKYADECA